MKIYLNGKYEKDLEIEYSNHNIIDNVKYILNWNPVGIFKAERFYKFGILTNNVELHIAYGKVKSGESFPNFDIGHVVNRMKCEYALISNSYVEIKNNSIFSAELDDIEYIICYLRDAPLIIESNGDIKIEHLTTSEDEIPNKSITLYVNDDSVSWEFTKLPETGYNLKLIKLDKIIEDNKINLNFEFKKEDKNYFYKNNLIVTAKDKNGRMATIDLPIHIQKI